MANILVCGAGPIGLATALMLDRAGHDVLVVERDEQPMPPTPPEAWDGWSRKSIPQFQQAHFVHARFARELEATLPDVAAQLEQSGALRYDQLGQPPPSIADREPRPDDDRFVTLTARRAWIEHAFATVAQRSLTVRRGVRLAGPVAGSSVVDGVPHIVGVRTVDGEEITADLVIDAMGRRSPLADWISGLGGRPPTEEGGDIGFTYYTRFFTGSAIPESRGALLAEFHTFTVLTLPADNNAWSVTLYAGTGDQPLKRFREPEVFEKVVRACPGHAHWMDGEPITGILAMSGVLDKLRTFVLDGAPVVTGTLAVGDSWACTNPSLGRGLSIGMIHARLLRDTIGDCGLDYEGLARRFHDVTEEQCTPWVRMQMDMDNARAASVQAARDGREQPGADPIASAFQTASMFDADVFRAFTEVVTCLSLPGELMARPGLVDKVMAAAQKGIEPGADGCPSRAQLLELVG